MDIFFTDPNDVPVPPEEVEIRELEAKQFPESSRIAVRFHITPFQKRPNIEIEINNEKGKKVSDLSVVEAIENKMTFIMHLRESDPGGIYTVAMRVFYSDLDSFELGERESAKANEILNEVGTTIDTSEFSFEVQTGD